MRGGKVRQFLRLRGWGSLMQSKEQSAMLSLRLLRRIGACVQWMRFRIMLRGEGLQEEEQFLLVKDQFLLAQLKLLGNKKTEPIQLSSLMRLQDKEERMRENSTQNETEFLF